MSKKIEVDMPTYIFINNHRGVHYHDGKYCRITYASYGGVRVL